MTRMAKSSEQSGFDDRFYFSRIYHKYRLLTPSQHRRRYADSNAFE
jgi:transcriptional regulator GlxA family with amidase domain